MSSEARKLREYISEIVPKQLSKVQVDKLRGKPLQVDVHMYENWLTKKGQIKKLDAANREKFTVDSVFKCLGIDDKFIVKLSLSKVQDITQEKVILEIKEAIW